MSMSKAKPEARQRGYVGKNGGSAGSLAGRSYSKWPCGWAIAALLAFGCNSTQLCEGGLCEASSRDAAVNPTKETSESAEDETSSESRGAATSTSAESRPAAETGSSSSETTEESADPVCDPQTEAGCSGGTPWCLRARLGSDGTPQESRCVECKEDVHCNWPHVAKDISGICVDYQCVTCDLEFNDGCPEEAPYCVLEQHETSYDADASVDSIEPGCSDCLVDAGAKRADWNGARRCVECETDEHCTQTDASRCDAETNTCVGCTASEQCEHLSATPVCDVTAGECVQCTLEESAACGEGRVCNMAEGTVSYRTCSEFEVASTGLCGECVNDEQCIEGYKCALEALFYTPAIPTGKRYCLKETPEEGCAGEAPFVIDAWAKTVNGAEGRFCALRYATCASYLMYGKGPDVVPEGYTEEGAPTCLRDESCGLPELNDGVCLVYTGNVSRCTYECFDDYDCPRSPPVACQRGYCSVAN